MSKREREREIHLHFVLGDLQTLAACWDREKDPSLVIRGDDNQLLVFSSHKRNIEVLLHFFLAMAMVA